MSGPKSIAIQTEARDVLRVLSDGRIVYEVPLANEEIARLVKKADYQSGEATLLTILASEHAKLLRRVEDLERMVARAVCPRCRLARGVDSGAARYHRCSVSDSAEERPA